MQNCRAAKCIEAIRVALLDPCTLQPIPGETNGYAIGCIIEPSWGPEVEEGEESVVKDDCGNICHRDDRCDQVKRHNLEFKIANPDPEFQSLLQGLPLIEQDLGEDGLVSIGVRHVPRGCSPYLFVELFERTEGCDDDGAPIYFRHVFPAARLQWTDNEREGVFRILQIAGKTKDVLTDGIGSGPFLDIPDDVIVSASDGERTDYVWFEDTTVPVVQCGFTEVPLPVAITGLAANCPAQTVTITGENLDLILGYFEINSDECSVIRGYNAASTNQAGAVAVAESPTSVTLDTGYDFDCACTASSITVYGGDGNLIGTFPLDPVVDLCCAAPDSPPGFTIPAGHATGQYLSIGAQGIVEDSVGRFLVSASVDSAGQVAAGIWRFLADGTPDPAWGTGGLLIVSAGTSREHALGIAVDASDSAYLLMETHLLAGPTTHVKLAKITAGALDAGFGAGGFVNLTNDGSATPGGVLIEDANNLVYVAYRQTAGGSFVDGLNTADGSASANGLTSSNTIRAIAFDPADLNTVLLSLFDGNTNNLYLGVGILSINSLVETLVGVDGVDFKWGQNVTDEPMQIVVESGSGHAWVASYAAANDTWSIQKFDTAGPALDGTFSGDGIATGTVYLAGGGTGLARLAGGDLVGIGHGFDVDHNTPLAFRVDSVGAPVGSFGAGGTAEFPAILALAAVSGSAAFHAMSLDEGAGHATVVGYIENGAGPLVKVVIARFLLADGTLDTSFGAGLL